MSTALPIGETGLITLENMNLNQVDRQLAWVWIYDIYLRAAPAPIVKADTGIPYQRYFKKV